MFYVYGLFDSSTGECFYVGKGSKNRMLTHVKKVLRGSTTDNPHLDRKIRKLLSESIDITYVKFVEDIRDENQAYLIEAEYIAQIGLDNLCNCWSGGLGSRIPTEETRAKISANRRGIPVSEESKQKMREAKLGTKMSETSSVRKSAALKGKPQSEAQQKANEKRREKMSGRSLSEEHKSKLREAKLANPTRYWKDKKLSEEHKAKISAGVISAHKDISDEQSNG